MSKSFSKQFIAAISKETDLETNPEANVFVERMQSALDAGNPEYLGDCLRGLFASIPYSLHIGREAYYHSIFLAVMQFLGFKMAGEDSVANGRMDGCLERPNGKVYVMEMKYRPSGEDGDTGRVLEAELDKAMAQIEARRYADKYAGMGKAVYKVAIAVAGRGDVRVKVSTA